MSVKKREYFSGKTLQQAIIAAACEYGLAPEEVAYRQIEKRHGFLRTPKKILIAVDPTSPKREAGAGPDSEPAAEPGAAHEVSRPAAASRLRSETELGASVDSDEEGRAARRGRPGEGERPEARGPRQGAADRSRSRSGDRRDSSARDERRRDGSAREGGSQERGRERKGQSRGASVREPSSSGSRKGQGGGKAGSGRSGLHAPYDAVAEEQAAHARRAMERERAEEEALRRADVEEESGERRHRRERRQTDSGEESQAASEAMESLVAVTGLDLEVEVTVDGDDVEVEIGGPDAELLLEEEGKPLSAIEHLLPKVLRGISGRKYFCHVDCLGFRERRRSELETLARELADEVRETGDSRTLEPLSPAERRIVHMSLADDPDVETESTGGGYLKRLTIWPV